MMIIIMTTLPFDNDDEILKIVLSSLFWSQSQNRDRPWQQSDGPRSWWRSNDVRRDVWERRPAA
jgi:hypothetical protein